MCNYNPTELLYKEINEEKRKVRLLICNSNDEILVAHYNGIYMLPGGTLEENEIFDNAIKKALRREIKEEVGVDIATIPLKHLDTIKHYQERYPKVNGEVVNRIVTTDYYKTKMDIDLDDIESNLTDREKEGGFYLEWINKYKLRDLLINGSFDNPRSEFFHDELRIILSIYLHMHDFDLIDKNYEKLKKKKAKYVDMHTHTVYSDGEFEPRDLIEKALNNNIGTISITDHDNILAYSTLKDDENIKKGLIKLIPGIELSAKVPKGRMHILGYNIDLENDALNNKMTDLRNNSFYYIIALLNQIKIDYDIMFDYRDIKELFNKRGNIGRPDLAKLLVKYGLACNVQDAFNRYLIPAYEKTRGKTKGLPYEECIKLIKEAGGISVLAHPNQLLMDDVELEDTLKNMIECGLDGIEVYHSCHTKEETEKYLELAEKYNLLISGGSDYHGSIVKPDIEIGQTSNGKIKILSLLDKIK